MRIIDEIYCDDIRFEQRGKHSIIGTYHDLIFIETPEGKNVNWPISFRVAVFLRIDLDGFSDFNREISFRLEMIYKDKAVAWVDGVLMISDVHTRILSLPTGPFPVQLPEEGEFTTILRLNLPSGEVELHSNRSLPVRVRKLATN